MQSEPAGIVEQLVLTAFGPPIMAAIVFALSRAFSIAVEGNPPSVGTRLKQVQTFKLFTVVMWALLALIFVTVDSKWLSLHPGTRLRMSCELVVDQQYGRAGFDA